MKKLTIRQKKLLTGVALLLCAALVFALCACGAPDTRDASSGSGCGTACALCAGCTLAACAGCALCSGACGSDALGDYYDGYVGGTAGSIYNN